QRDLISEKLFNFWKGDGCRKEYAGVAICGFQRSDHQPVGNCQGIFRRQARAPTIGHAKVAWMLPPALREAIWIGEGQQAAGRLAAWMRALCVKPALPLGRGAPHSLQGRFSCSCPAIALASEKVKAGPEIPVPALREDLALREERRDVAGKTPFLPFADEQHVGKTRVAADLRQTTAVGSDAAPFIKSGKLPEEISRLGQRGGWRGIEPGEFIGISGTPGSKLQCQGSQIRLQDFGQVEEIGRASGRERGQSPGGGLAIRQ